MNVQVVVTKSGAAVKGISITETRKVYDDYKKLFGEEPPLAIGKRLQINSQHTGIGGELLFGCCVQKAVAITISSLFREVRNAAA